MAASLAELEAKLASLTTEGGGLASDPPDGSGALSPKERGARQPLRDLVLTALEELGCPAYSRQLAVYLKVTRGRSISPERFGSLSRDELEAYRRAPSKRPVWLCHVLTADRHEVIRRLWARSDWPREWRVFAPTSGRVQQLAMTRRLCELALDADRIAVDPQMLRIFVADHARALPGVTVQRGVFELDEWRRRAAEELARWEEADRVARAASAEWLRARPPLHQLFGVLERYDGGQEAEAGAASPRGRHEPQSHLRPVRES